MHRAKQLIRRLLIAFGVMFAVLIPAGIIGVCINRSDIPPPDMRSLIPPPRAPAVPANSNGWYCIREAVRNLCIPDSTSTSQLHTAWLCPSADPVTAHEILASNALALAWIDRAVSTDMIVRPDRSLPEDANILGWSPVSACGRMLRLRAWLSLQDGHPEDALQGAAASVRLARLYLRCNPGNEQDALAAFAEVRNALLGMRQITAQLDPGVVWNLFNHDLCMLADQQEMRRKASAIALEHDRQELDHLYQWMTGTSHDFASSGSIFACMLPDNAAFSRNTWYERQAIALFNLLPLNYRLQRNRTLDQMAAIRSGEKPPAYACIQSASRSPRGILFNTGILPLIYLLSPNGFGKIYVIVEAGKQAFIDGGARLAECSARGTRLVLALRLYEQSCGSLPERLDALVPQWIEAVPADPYDGQPFRYARDRRLVYSVGSSRHDMEGRGGNVLFSVSQNPDFANVQTGAVYDH